MNNDDKLIEQLEQDFSGVSVEDLFVSDRPVRETTDEESESDEKRLLKKYPCLEAALNVLKEDDTKHLFIFCMKGEEGKDDTIRFYKKPNQPISVSITEDQNIVTMNSNLKDIFEKQDHTQKDEVITLGKSLFKRLLYKFLFSVINDAKKVEDDLDKGITEQLQDEFKTKGFSIFEDSIVTKEADGKWEITDGEKIYNVEKERRKLNIYCRVNEVLPETLDEEYLVWICGEIDYINAFWEWIYTGEGKPFFWGDKYHIVRIRKDCDMSECLLVNKKIFILANAAEAHSFRFARRLLSTLQKAGVSDRYLFSWDNVPGVDNERLLRYLVDDHNIDWVTNAEIHKSDDGKNIRIYKDENSAEITISEGEKATLKIRDDRTQDLQVKEENDKLNIYRCNCELIRSPEGNIDFSDDCIILYAAGNDESIREIYESRLGGILALENKILFLNLYPPGLLKLNSLPAAWIDSRFDNITEEITLSFVDYFFKAYKMLLNERTKVRVTEIVAKTRETMEKENILMRLACVVNGNPNLSLTALDF